MDEFFAELARLVTRTAGRPPASDLARAWRERYDSIFTSACPPVGPIGLPGSERRMVAPSGGARF